MLSIFAPATSQALSLKKYTQYLSLNKYQRGRQSKALRVQTPDQTLEHLQTFLILLILDVSELFQQQRPIFIIWIIHPLSSLDCVLLRQQLIQEKLLSKVRASF